MHAMTYFIITVAKSLLWKKQNLQATSSIGRERETKKDRERMSNCKINNNQIMLVQERKIILKPSIATKFFAWLHYQSQIHPQYEERSSTRMMQKY